jgi:hypothetical protein
MTYKQLSGLIRATLTKEQEDKEVEIRIGDQSYSNLALVSTEEDTFLQPQPARTCTQNPET